MAGGFFLGGRSQRSSRPGSCRSLRQPVVIVTPEQRREIARAFALHESVAGPLSWYAADDSTIQVAPAEKGETLRQPIAVVLRLTQDLSVQAAKPSPPKTYVIVCRNNDAATIELPPSAMAKTIRLRLLSTATNGQVNLQYAMAADGSDRGPDEAATGRPSPRRPRPNLLGTIGHERLPGQRRCQRLGDPGSTQAIALQEGTFMKTYTYLLALWLAAAPWALQADELPVVFARSGQKVDVAGRRRSSAKRWRLRFSGPTANAGASR